MNKKLAFTILSVIYIALLLLGGTILNVSDASKTPGFDKALHFIGFFILAFLLILTFTNYSIKNKLLITFLAAIFIGIMIEFIQLFIPARTFSLLDLAADLAGIVLALVLSWGFARR
jgi:VanZ family protein